jgi:hypothetical protein
MEYQERIMLLDLVSEHGFSAVKDAIIRNNAILAVLPTMDFSVKVGQSIKYTRLEDGRIFKNEELVQGPDGTMVVKKELEAMIRKIERRMR